MADRSAPGPADECARSSASGQGGKRRDETLCGDVLGGRPGKEARMAENDGGVEGATASAAAQVGSAASADVTPALDPPCYILMHSLSKK